MVQQYKKKLAKFCLLTTQRSGSTWLTSLLNCHPELRMLPDELFKLTEGGIKQDFDNNENWINEQLISFVEFRKTNFGKRPWLDEMHRLVTIPRFA